MATAATIAIKLEAQTATLKKGFADAQRQVSGFAGNVKRSMRLLQLDAALNIGRQLSAVIGNVFSQVKQQIDSLADVSDFADRLGMSPQNLMALRQATEQFGGNASALNMGLQRLSKNAERAALGQKEFRVALERLGISVHRFARLDPYEKFLRFADAIKAVKGEGAQLEAVVKMMDTEGASLTHTLRQGSAALEDYMGRMRDNVTLTEEQLRQTQKYSAAHKELMAQLDAAKGRLALTLAEPWMELTRWQIKAIELYDTFWDRYQRGIRRLFGVGEPGTGPLPGFEKGRIVAEIGGSSINKLAEKLLPIGAVTSTTMEGFRALMEAQRGSDDSAWEREVLDRFDRLIALTRDRVEVRKYSL